MLPTEMLMAVSVFGPPIFSAEIKKRWTSAFNRCHQHLKFFHQHHIVNNIKMAIFILYFDIFNCMSRNGK